MISFSRLVRLHLSNFIFTVGSGALRSAGGVLYSFLFSARRSKKRKKEKKWMRLASNKKNSVQFISGARSVHTVINCSVCSRFFSSSASASDLVLVLSVLLLTVMQ